MEIFGKEIDMLESWREKGGDRVCHIHMHMAAE